RRSLSRAVLRRLRVGGGRPTNEGRRWRGTGHLFEQLLKDTGARLPRRVDRRPGAARRETGDGETGSGPVHRCLRSTYRPRARTTGDPETTAASSSGALREETRRDGGSVPSRAGQSTHLAGLARRILSLGHTA